ncbi:MAG TPA: Clp protease N-terminal domain-containing protein [Solirubrobacteraceae bacterium]|nr:Clp protease N-terminal domain-containing protein [Solirubrobacteraceae bacterium]
MVAVPATVEQLAHDAVHIPDPETALRALSALRLELDQIEPELVARALQGGATWSDVARALGVSKQAAHRKHRELARTLQLSSPGGGPKVLVTAEARRAIQLARDEARQLGQPAVGTEHILLGILRCRGSQAVQTLNALGVTHEAARLCVQPTMPGLAPDRTAGDSEGGDRQGGDRQGVTPHARRILEGSLREAAKRHEGYIGVEHILLALLTDSRNGAVQTLEALKTTPKAIRRRLDGDWDAISAASEAAGVEAHTIG